MRIFLASYYHSFALGAEIIVVAATIDDVVPDVLDIYPRTLKECWDVTEIDTTKRDSIVVKELK